MQFLNMQFSLALYGSSLLWPNIFLNILIICPSYNVTDQVSSLSGCVETSANNYQSRLLNLPQQRRSHLHRGGNLNSRIRMPYHLVLGLKMSDAIPQFPSQTNTGVTTIKYFLKLLHFNTLRTGDADLRFYITTVQDGWHKFAFLTRACFPCTIHLIMQYIEPVSEWSCRRMIIETWPHSELTFGHRASSI